MSLHGPILQSWQDLERHNQARAGESHASVLKELLLLCWLLLFFQVHVLSLSLFLLLVLVVLALVVLLLLVLLLVEVLPFLLPPLLLLFSLLRYCGATASSASVMFPLLEL